MLNIVGMNWSSRGLIYTIYCTECERRFTCSADSKKVGCRECRERMDTSVLEGRWKGIPNDVAQEEYHTRLDSLLMQLREKMAAHKRLKTRKVQAL